LLYNDLKSIPSTIGNLIRLKKLDLNVNELVSLPPEIGRLQKNTKILLRDNPKLKIIPRTLRGHSALFKNDSAKFEPIVRIPIVRKNVPLNTKRNDPISGYNFSVGNNALIIGGYNRYVTENSLLRWIKTKKPNTNINNINTLYTLNPNEEIVSNPFTRQPLFRRNINFVKFVKPNTPNTLVKKLNTPNKPKTLNPRNNMIKKAGNAAQSRLNTTNKPKTPNTTNKPNTPNTPKTPNTLNTIRKKAGNAAQSRRTNVNNNN